MNKSWPHIGHWTIPLSLALVYGRKHKNGMLATYTHKDMIMLWISEQYFLYILFHIHAHIAWDNTQLNELLLSWLLSRFYSFGDEISLYIQNRSISLGSWWSFELCSLIVTTCFYVLLQPLISSDEEFSCHT